MSGKAAIVTGASGGIGAAVAAELAGNGMDVCLVARRAAVMEELATTMRRPGRIVTVCPADLSHPDAPAVVVAHAVAAFGGVDLLVNCAGDTKRGDFFALTEDDWQAGFALKFFGTVRLCRAAWPHLVARRGGVVTIIGMGARTPAAEFTIGGSVNSALMNFTKALADIGLRDAVRVNAVNPGWIATERAEPEDRLDDAGGRSDPRGGRGRIAAQRRGDAAGRGAGRRPAGRVSGVG